MAPEASTSLDKSPLPTATQVILKGKIPMNKTAIKLSLVFVALLASSAAFGFNPQPDPPGKQKAIAGMPAQTAFNPQPDPPGRQGTTACPQGAPRDPASGLPSGKRKAGERKSGGNDLSAAGAASSGGEACGFEHPK
jgi:hypothetical protein